MKVLLKVNIKASTLEHIEDLDRGRIAHVLSQRKKNLPANPIFLGLPQDKTYAINSVARFLRTNSKVKIFGDNGTSYKAVFTNLGRNEDVYMNAKYIGLRTSRFGEKDTSNLGSKTFHPLIEKCKIKDFIKYDHDLIIHELNNIDIVIGNELHFSAELVNKIYEKNSSTLKLIVLKVREEKDILMLSEIFQTGWTYASYRVGVSNDLQNNFIAWKYDLPTETIQAIIENIHPIS